MFHHKWVDVYLKAYIWSSQAPKGSYLSLSDGEEDLADLSKDGYSYFARAYLAGAQQH